MRWLLCLVATGCIESSLVRCPDGRTCPAGTVCDDVHALCVDPAQVAACEGLDDRADCDAIAMGRCYDGVCLARGCGNNLDDPSDGEVCDDGNRIAGDGCSADCMSTEVCRNEIVDRVPQNLEDCDDGNPVGHDGCSSSCSSETVRWSPVFAAPHRAEHSMAYDPVRGRVVMFGGTFTLGLVVGGGSDVRGDTWEWDGLRWTLANAQISPAPRNNAAMAYDPASRGVLLVGGSDSAAFSDTWLWDGGSWHRLETDVAPPPRGRHALAYHAVREQVVLFGGDRLDGTDTWLWDGATRTWSVLEGPSPPPRGDFGMAYDPVRGVIVVFGGDDNTTTLLDDTWELDATGWKQVFPARSPSARKFHSLVYDAASARMLMLGGETADGDLPLDMWSYDGTTWTTVPVSALPPGLAGASLATDIGRGRIVHFSGQPAWNPESDPDEEPNWTWEWDGTQWIEISHPRAVPTARFGHAMAFDPLSRRALLFGGDAKGETWLWRDGWQQLVPSIVPPPRSFGALGYDRRREHFVLFGGFDPVANQPRNDTWTFDGSAWSKRPDVMRQPSPRHAHAMTWDDARGVMVLFGGATGIDIPLDDMWTWDGTQWLELEPMARPEPRFGASMAYDPIRKVILLFGGEVGSTNHVNDTWEWDGTTWMQRVMVDSPPPRSYANLVWNPLRRRLVLFGGETGISLVRNDAWEWDGSRWTRFDVVQPPAARAAASLVWMFDGLVLFGGGKLGCCGNLVEPMRDMWRLSFDGARPYETCGPLDTDDDGLVGCSDPDCYLSCTPVCEPMLDSMSPPCSGRRCGDAACDGLETCASCPADCGACPPRCGDTICEPGDSCPGECP